jgi:hypothetical protein
MLEAPELRGAIQTAVSAITHTPRGSFLPTVVWAAYKTPGALEVRSRPAFQATMARITSLLQEEYLGPDIFGAGDEWHPQGLSAFVVAQVAAATAIVTQRIGRVVLYDMVAAFIKERPALLAGAELVLTKELTVNQLDAVCWAVGVRDLVLDIYKSTPSGPEHPLEKALLRMRPQQKAPRGSK